MESETNVENRKATLPPKAADLIAEIRQKRGSNCITGYQGFKAPFDNFIRPWGHNICGGSLDPVQEPTISDGVDL